MEAFIAVAANGGLYCKETKQKFGVNYYTMADETSDLIDNLIARSKDAKEKNTGGIIRLHPSHKDIDEKMLKAMVEGPAFPGSNKMSKDIIEKYLDADELRMWQQKFPGIFKKPGKAVKAAKSKPSAAKPAVSPDEDVFGEIE